MNNKKELKLILIGLGIFVLISLVVFLMGTRRFTACFNIPIKDYDKAEVILEPEGIVTVTDKWEYKGYYFVRVSGLNPGDVFISVEFESETGGKASYHYSLRVTKNNIIFGNYAFDGFKIITLLFGCFLLYAAVVLFIAFLRCEDEKYFSYERIMHLGMSMYFAGIGAMFTVMALFFIFVRFDIGADTILVFSVSILSLAILFLLPFILIYALLLSISNIVLVKHEGFRPVNLLGVLLSFLMMAGSLIVIVSLLFYGGAFVASNKKDLVEMCLRSVISGLILYFILILLSTQFVLIRSPKKKLTYDKDYIIILGCKIRPDGTLYPLIRGRVDKAIAFYKEQLEHSGKKAIFIPSGGQGSDEIISEGEAMKRYLMEAGIPEEQIMAETESVNTFQNMAFSKKIIEDSSLKDPKIVFSTTNYHVFRSGIIAKQAGLTASGIGSKTKWFFWPNAQIREFIGLVVKKWKIHLITIAILTLVALLLANLGNLLNVVTV